MKATERIFRTADGRHVREAHPDAAFLAYPVGHEMPDDVAAELYPADVEPAPEAEPTVEPEATAEPAAEEKATPPAANKARKPAANK